MQLELGEVVGLAAGEILAVGGALDRDHALENVGAGGRCRSCSAASAADGCRCGRRRCGLPRPRGGSASGASSTLRPMAKKVARTHCAFSASSTAGVVRRVGAVVEGEDHFVVGERAGSRGRSSSRPPARPRSRPLDPRHAELVGPAFRSGGGGPQTAPRTPKAGGEKRVLHHTASSRESSRRVKPGALTLLYVCGSRFRVGSTIADRHAFRSICLRSRCSSASPLRDAAEAWTRTPSASSAAGPTSRIRATIPFTASTCRNIRATSTGTRSPDSGVKFAWIKATEGGDHVDAKFQANWEAAKAVGIPRGAYHFVYWCRSPLEEVRWFEQNVPVEADALPPVLDVESDSGIAHLPQASGAGPDHRRHQDDAGGDGALFRQEADHLHLGRLLPGDPVATAPSRIIRCGCARPNITRPSLRLDALDVLAISGRRAHSRHRGEVDRNAFYGTQASIGSEFMASLSQ